MAGAGIFRLRPLSRTLKSSAAAMTTQAGAVKYAANISNAAVTKRAVGIGPGAISTAGFKHLFCGMIEVP